MSCSVYLVHGPLVQTLILAGLFHNNLLFLVGIVCAVLCISFVTERLIERPGNALDYRLAWRLRHRADVVPRAA